MRKRREGKREGGRGEGRSYGVGMGGLKLTKQIITGNSIDDRDGWTDRRMDGQTDRQTDRRHKNISLNKIKSLISSSKNKTALIN
jgi:hypothetical protein